MKIMLKLTTFCLLFYNCLTSLIWADDFENNNLATFGNWTPVYYKNVLSPYAGWYTSFMGYIQLKSIVNISTTIGIQLSTNAAYTLCRNFTLLVGQKYQLNSTFYCSLILQQMTFSTFINNNLISTQYIPNSNGFNKQTTYFYPNFTSNTICLNQTHIFNNSFLGTYTQAQIDGTGGMVDNFTLHLIDLYFINFTCNIDNNSNLVILTSNITYRSLLVQQIQSQYQLKYNNQSFVKTKYTYDNTSILQPFIIQITSNFSYYLNGLHFVSLINPLSPPLINFKLYLNCPLNDFFSFNNPTQTAPIAPIAQVNKSLPSSNISNIPFNIQFTESILILINAKISSIINIFRLIFNSYYMYSLISFQNLSLYYIFLKIHSIPEFTRKIYHELLKIYFQEQTIIQWLCKLINFDKNSLEMNAQKQNIQQLIEETTKQGYFWFGRYGFTSQVFNNNVSNVILLGFFVFKLGLIKMLLRFLSTKTIKLLKIKTCFKIVIIVQFIMMLPQFIISAVPTIKVASLKSADNIEKICQLLILFLCLISLPLHSILTRLKFAYKQKKLKYQKTKKKEEIPQEQLYRKRRIINLKQKNDKLYHFPICQIKKNKLKLKKTFYDKINIFERDRSLKSKNITQKQINNKNKYKYKYTSFENKSIDGLLFFSIPFLVNFENPLYLLIPNSFILLIQLIVSLVEFKNQLKIKLFIKVLVIFVWMIHHSIFFAFYLLEYRECETNEEIIKILGFLAVITLLTGYLLQIFKFVITLITLLNSFFRKCIKFYKLSSLKQKIFPKQGRNKKKSYIIVFQYKNKNIKSIIKNK